MITLQEVQEAKEIYAEGRLAIQAAIKNNQKSLKAFRLLKSEENKQALEVTRKAHKATIDNIKIVRDNYYRLDIGYKDQLDANS